MEIKKWNDNWKFWIKEDAFALDWNPPKDWQEVTLPHDAMLHSGQREDSQNRGNAGYYDGGNYHYAKYLKIPEGEKGKKYLLKFEGVYQNAAVFVNHQAVGGRHYGYSEFYVCLDPYLEAGKENEIHVSVKNGMSPNSRWYSGGGIYRDVYLCASGFLYISPDRVELVTEEADEAVAAQRVTVEIANEESQARETEVWIRIMDSDGREVASDHFPAVLPPGEKTVWTRRLFVENPSLWSAESPSLYQCEIRLMENGCLLDSHKECLGIRTLQLDPKRGLRVNGKTVNLRGACVHHDSGVLGAAAYEDALYRQVFLLKKAGFNAIRSSHQPMAPAMLRACDELGMYVMDEAFDMWEKAKSAYDYSLYFRDDWEKDVEAMVRKDTNHPCVLMYSIGNEIPECGTKGGSLTGQRISRKIHSLDSRRYTVLGMNGIFMAGDKIAEVAEEFLDEQQKTQGIRGNVNAFMTAMSAHMKEIIHHPVITDRIDRACAGVDIAGYNYMQLRYEADGEKYPNRVIVGSESYPPAMAGLWADVMRFPYLIGDFTWTGWDYIGEAGVGIPAYRRGEGGFGAKYPCSLAFTGDMDITGFRRPLSYLREIVFGLRKDPYIAVQNPAHWGEKVIKTNWMMSDADAEWSYEGYEGKPVIVEVYAGGDEVELFQDGKSLGRKKSGGEADFRVLYETVFQKGKLTAVSYEKGEITGEVELVSAGKPEALDIKPELYKNQELLFVQIQLKDAMGIPVTREEWMLEADVEGGTLLGFGNGDPKNVEGYLGKRTKTFKGRAFLVVKREGGEQEIRIRTDRGMERSLRYSC